jgi:phosphate transport system substrate-binding protein
VCPRYFRSYGQGAIFVGFLARLGHVAVASSFLLSLIASAPLCASANGVIRVGGSTNITPPLSKMVPSYQSAHPGTIVSVTGSSSGLGIAALRAGELDVAASDVAVDDPAFADTPVGVIGIAFVVGSGAGIKNLTRDQVAGVYSGKITNWKQIGGNDLTIVPFSRPIGAGTRFIFEMNVAKTLIDMKEQKDATSVVNAVAATPGGIGYASVNYLGDHQNLAISYEGVAPTDQNIASHAYKFSADEHIYTLKTASPDVKAFVAYAATQQAIFKAGGIVSATGAASSALRVEGTLNQTSALQKAAAAYLASHMDASINVKGTNSGQAIAALKSGSIDVAASDIAVDPADFPNFVDTTIGVMGVVILAGPHTGLKNITREQLIGMYSGKITNWKQVGGEDQPVVAFGRAIGTGTRLLFETKVAKVEIPTQDPVNPAELVHDIATTPGAIGYIATQFVSDHPELVLTYNGVAPNPANIRNHTYTFSTDEHLYVLKGGPATARDFVTFVNSQRGTLASFGIY